MRVRKCFQLTVYHEVQLILSVMLKKHTHTIGRFWFLSQLSLYPGERAHALYPFSV